VETLIKGYQFELNSLWLKNRYIKVDQTRLYLINQTQNKEERYSRVPRLSDTRYSAK